MAPSLKRLNVSMHIKRLSKIIRFFIPTLIFLLILEIITRIINPPPWHFTFDQGMYVEAYDFSFRLTPGFKGTQTKLQNKITVNVDDMGFRNDHNGNFQIDTSRDRILLIGDSMTFGQGVEYSKTFSALLDQDKYQAINAGVSRYSPINTYLYLQDLGPKIKPKIVVYTFFIGNDLSDNFDNYSFQVSNNKVLVNISSAPGYSGLLRKRVRELSEENVPESTRSADSTDNPSKDVKKEQALNTQNSLSQEAISIIKSSLDRIALGNIVLNSRSVVHEPVYSEEVTFGFLDSLLIKTSKLYRFLRFKLFMTPAYKDIYMRRGISNIVCPPIDKLKLLYENGDDSEEWILTKDLILEMEKLTDDLGAKFILVIIPEKEIVVSDALQLLEDEGCFKAVDADFGMPNKIFKEFSETNGINLIDPTQAYKRSYKEGRSPYLPIDSHINEEGHRIIAELVDEYINSLTIE